MAKCINRSKSRKEGEKMPFPFSTSTSKRDLKKMVAEEKL